MIRVLMTSLLALSLAVPMALPALSADSEAAVAPEVSPPGDIPDNQAFIVFNSPAGFSIKVPEGWARKDDTGVTVYNDKYNHISLAISDLATPLGIAYAQSALAPQVKQQGHAVQIVEISEVKLKSGKAIKIAFDSNSEPNTVTGKQVREENEAFYFSKGGKLVTLQLSAPKGADNVDQWKLISSSFKWN